MRPPSAINNSDYICTADRLAGIPLIFFSYLHRNLKYFIFNFIKHFVYKTVEKSSHGQQQKSKKNLIKPTVD